MSRNQDSLYNLISRKLSENTYGVDFQTDIYNSGNIRYYTEDESGQKHRFVPVMITDVIGQYINIPNANSTSNSVGVSFEIFSGTVENKDTDITEFSKVGYTNTLNAIEEFKSSLLAKYFPLGTPYLYMGGEDSTFVIETTTATDIDSIVLDFKPFNTDEETIINFFTLPTTLFYKDSTNIVFQIDTGFEISIPYVANERVTITITKNASDLWTITDGTNTDTITKTKVINVSKVTFGSITGFEGIVYSLSLEDTTSLGNEVVIDTWNSKDMITNSGDKVLDTDTIINNCILWSDDGNAIFSFGTLNPISDLHSDDGETLYQMFELEIEVFISNDVLFGNNFEYYLDGVQVYPIDRQHSLGTEVSSAQTINGNENLHIIDETSRDHSLSFYYIPTKKLTKLLKHIVNSTVEQNTVYTLKVQYPFFNVSYDVVLDSGGLQPNINTISSFSVTFKKKIAF